MALNIGHSVRRADKEASALLVDPLMTNKKHNHSNEPSVSLPQRRANDKIPQADETQEEEGSARESATVKVALFLTTRGLSVEFVGEYTEQGGIA